MAVAAYVMFTGDVADAQAWLAGVPAPVGDARLTDLTTAFKKNFARLFGEEARSRDLSLPVVVNGATFRATGATSLAVTEAAYQDIAVRFNVYCIVRVEPPAGMTNPREIEAALIAAVTPPADEWKSKDRDPDRIRALYPIDEVTQLLAASKKFSVEVRAIEEFDDNTIASCAIYAYYILGGYSLVEIEHAQIGLELKAGPAKHLRDAQNMIVGLRIKLANTRRRFLSISQAYNPLRREFCETVMEQFRLRRRAQWHDELNAEFERALAVLAAQAQARSAELTGRILFLLTAFTVLSGLFFGLFQIDLESEVARSGPLALIDPRLVTPLAVSIAALIMLYAAAAFWPRRH